MTITIADSAESEAPLLNADGARSLGIEIQSAAARVAEGQAEFFELLGDFDRGEGYAQYHGVKSLAHWIGWACSVSDHTAREYVRVARGLRRMPRIAEMFAGGQISYSKVREVTRLVDFDLEEEELARLALFTTASQLARTIASFRMHAGSRIEHEAKRGFVVAQREDGMVRISAVLPAEEAALVVAAVDTAKHRIDRQRAADADEMAGADESTVVGISAAQAFVSVAGEYLDAMPAADTAGDRSLVIVHVNAETLTENVPAGTDAPSPIATGKCHVEGVGRIEPETARRMACVGRLLGAVVNNDGDVLVLGRTRRLASKAQHRALMIRDTQCQFPGCWQRHHLDAHHITPWSRGGSTDVDDMILLCRTHHTCVHEGGVRILPSGAPAQGAMRGTVKWAFLDPEGQRIEPGELAARRADPERLALVLRSQHDREPQRIFPPGGGEGFVLANCVEWLFAMTRGAAALAA